MAETISYLAGMTRMLQSQYEKKEIRVIPSSVLHPQTYMRLQQKLRKEDANKEYCITFSAFSDLADKSETLCLRDLFLKMLMCIKGITGEKAIEVQKIWLTPAKLIQAFEDVEASAKSQGLDSAALRKKKEELIATRLGGLNMIPRKKIAKGLSAKVAEVWG